MKGKIVRFIGTFLILLSLVTAAGCGGSSSSGSGSSGSGGSVSGSAN